MVGGGYGAAPHAFLAEVVTKLGSTVDFCVGAKNYQDILFENRIKKLPRANVYIATDDGSGGHRGYITDLVPALIEKAKRSFARRGQAQDDNERVLVVTCGPELMEKKILDLCNAYNAECEISIERFMKCGFGVCGQCCVDPLGLRMCAEGPVVDRATANKLTEFGKYHRDKSGAKKFY